MRASHKPDQTFDAGIRVTYRLTKWDANAYRATHGQSPLTRNTEHFPEVARQVRPVHPCGQAGFARDIASKLANESGLPGMQLVERSGSEEISAAYEQNRQDALAADVFGSPVYVLEGEVFWGQDRLELLGDALQSARAPYSSRV